ncbi:MULTISPECIES: BACON domain-containing protein [Butyricimonas]|uniref:BACON domain-containing protein n=1 Tax=Butyricimonas TaxID=574697 RepID=UPI0016520E39|nr:MULTISPECIES: BACON domain-containing protein [Butyricimonas]
MKRLFVFLACLMSLAIFSCSDSKDDNGDDPNGGNSSDITLELSITDIVFEAEGGEKEFYITCNGDWTITNTSQWCKTDITSGNGNATISVTVNPSELYDDQNTNITVKAGTNTKILTVTQKKKDAILLTKDKYDLPTTGGDITVEVKSNITYTTTIPQEFNWIKQADSKSRALETKNLNFKIEANPNTDKREGFIIFKDNASELADTVHVYQAQKDELILTQDTYNVPAKGETINVELKTNVDYEVIIPEDAKEWIEQLVSRASRVDKLSFTILESTIYDERQAEIIIKDKNSDLADTLHVIQKQVDAIILSQNVYDVPTEGMKIVIELESNIEYVATISEEAQAWITKVSIESLGRTLEANSLHYEILANDTYKERKGEIIIKSKISELADTVKIIQKQKDLIDIKEKEFHVSSAGCNIKVGVNSNVDYIVNIPVSASQWITQIQSRMVTTDSLIFSVSPNTSYEDRYAEIVVQKNELRDTIKIYQKQNDAIILNEHLYDVSMEGCEISVEISSNVECEVQISSNAQDWIEMVQSRALVTSSLNFVVKPNPNYQERKGEIFIKDKNSSLADTIKIVQAAKSDIYIGDVTFSTEEELIRFREMGYKKIKGNVSIGGLLKTLQKLENQIVEIDGNVEINASYLTTLDGLYGLRKINGDLILRDAELVVFEGLNNLMEICGDFEIKAGSLSDFNTLKSFEGLENLETIGGRLYIGAFDETDYSFNQPFFNKLESFTGLSKLKSIGKDLEINAYTGSFNSLESFEGLENLESIGGNFKIRTRANLERNMSVLEGKVLHNLKSFKGLGKLKNINGNFEIQVSTSAYASLNSLTSFEGLENLETIGGNFELNAFCSVSSNRITEIEGLNSLASFKGLGKLNFIGGDFKISAETNVGTGGTDLYCLDALTSFEGLENLKTIGGNFTVKAQALNNYRHSTASSLNGLISFEGLDELKSIGGDLYVYSSSCRWDTGSSDPQVILAASKLDVLELPKLEEIGGALSIHAQELKKLTLNSFVNLGGDVFIGSDNVETLNIGKLNKVSGSFKIICRKVNMIEFTSLTSITGDLIISYCDLGLQNINGLSKLANIGGNLDINNNPHLTDISGLSSLATAKGVSITKCMNLYDFNVLKTVVQNGCEYYVSENGYNPTKYQILNGQGKPQE